MQLHNLVLNSAEQHTDRPAVHKGAECLRYGDLASAVMSVAANLTRMGIKPGDRVGIYLSKRLEAVIAYFAASYCGAIFVPINYGLRPAQVGHILRDCNVRMLITVGNQVEALRDELEACPDIDCIVLIGQESDLQPSANVRKLPWSALAEPVAYDAAPANRIDIDPAAILYTSGSTGKPKGVVLSHRNMVAGALSVAEYLRNDADDVIVAALPFSFDAGFSQMTTAFSVGASVALLDYLVPRDVIKACSRYRATGLAGVPPLWTQLVALDWPHDVSETLRYITNTGGAMPTATLTALRSKLPSTDIYLMYGLTEAFRSTFLPPDQLDSRPTSIGKAIPNAEILVVRDDGSVCDAGEPGELVHRGALVSLGYWNDPDRTAQRFKPVPNQPSGLPFEEIAVWSGDTVVKDEEGFIYFVGRKDDMIKSSGYRISPTELEEVVYGALGVNECAAIGVPHDALGQAVVVLVVTDKDQSDVQNSIVDRCKRELPNYMLPEKILFEDNLPRNNNGKIDRGALKQRYSHLFSTA